MVMLTFPALGLKYPFWRNLFKEIRIVILSLNVLSKVNDAVHFFCLRQEIIILDKFGPKVENCLFKVKLGVESN